MNKEYDLLVFIGRFQPFHEGHKAVIKAALDKAHHVLVLVGSPDQPRSTRNPFTYYERECMILDAFGYQDHQSLAVAPLSDQPYADDLWVGGVQRIVGTHAIKTGSTRIGLIGHSKDSTSYYLKLFPTWGSVEVPNVEGLNATDIRQHLFECPVYLDDLTEDVPENTLSFLKSFTATDHFKRLKDEHEHIRAYKESWEAAPYPPTFVTVDVVVIQSGHILLVERGAQPGKGLLALPGGFLNPEETVLDGAVRELREETRLKVPDPVLRGSVVTSRVFDDPKRSSRGRTITHAFLFHLTPGPLPKVKGSDDAAKAKWYPLASVDPSKMFEDHFAIIQRMTSAL